jgi:NAD(P)-dependent dehydrogenase (short-subunit alcohol dehydrogenase family)
MSRPISLTGQVIAVTGAGAGLGRAYALELARRGASVIVNDVTAAAVEAVVAEIADGGGSAASAVADVSQPEGGRSIIEEALERFGTVDGVIANAGIMRPAYVEDVDPATFRRTLAINLEGVFYVTRAAWPVMRAKGYGRIALVSSGGGILSTQANSAYAASKGGVFTLARTLAFEGREHGSTPCFPVRRRPWAVTTRSPTTAATSASSSRRRCSHCAWPRASPRSSPT